MTATEFKDAVGGITVARFLTHLHEAPRAHEWQFVLDCLRFDLTEQAFHSTVELRERIDAIIHCVAWLETIDWEKSP